MHQVWFRDQLPAIPQTPGRRPALHPIEQFRKMHDWRRIGPIQMLEAADVGSGYHVRLNDSDVLEFPLAQSGGDLRLEEAVTSGRAAAEMSFWNFNDFEPGGA